MSQNTSAIVIVRFDEYGDISYHVCGNEARLFIVDERTPHDRVYEWLPRSIPADIRGIIPQGAEIGSSRDERHPAIEHAILALQEGRPRLRAVEDEEPSA